MSERCFISLQDRQECIEANDFLCIGFDMGNLDTRTGAFSVISYKTFIKTNKNIFGAGNENINHIFPLYLSNDHWSIVEKNLNLFFQRYSYQKYPFQILSAVRRRQNNTEYGKKIIADIEQTCQAIINYYNFQPIIKRNVKNFINNYQFRQNICLPVFLAQYSTIFDCHNITKIKKISLLVIEEQLRRFTKKILPAVILQLLGIDAQAYIKKYFIHHLKNTEIEKQEFANFNKLTLLQEKYINGLNELFDTTIKQTKLIEIIADPKKIFGKDYCLKNILSYEQIIAMAIQFNNEDYQKIVLDMDTAINYLKNQWQNQIDIINRLCQSKIESDHLLIAV
jgi:hypothetical protein